MLFCLSKETAGGWLTFLLRRSQLSFLFKFQNQIKWTNHISTFVTILFLTNHIIIIYSKLRILFYLTHEIQNFLIPWFSFKRARIDYKKLMKFEEEEFICVDEEQERKREGEEEFESKKTTVTVLLFVTF